MFHFAKTICGLCRQKKSEILSGMELSKFLNRKSKDFEMSLVFILLNFERETSPVAKN